MRRSSPLSLPPITCLLAGALLAGPAAARPNAFEGTSQVVVVEVPVNVTGKDGRPVRGLGPEDFEILDEGSRREVVGFDVVDLEGLAGEPARERLETLPAVARRHFLFVFDLSFSDPTTVLRARLAAREFVLEGLHESDLAAVATYSQQLGPRLVISFTPDRAQLAHAIDTLGMVSPDAIASRVDDPLRLMIAPPGQTTSFESVLGMQNDAAATSSAIQEAMLEQNVQVARQFERSEKAFERSRIKAWSRSFADLARALDAVPGRKHVVLFSEGFDSRLLLGRQPDMQDDRQVQDQLETVRGNFSMVDTDDTFGSASLQGDVAEMLEAFRRADCVIQAVDTSGVNASFRTEGSRSGRGADALFYIANETGGELFEDANELGSELEKVLERSTVTYVLSFRADDLGNQGRYRRLKVRVDAERGVRVSHRAGYFEPRPYPELDPLEKSLLASEAIAAATPRNELGVDVLAAPFRSAPGAAYVPVIIEIAGRDLLAGHRGADLPVELYAYVTDAEGEMRDFFNQLVSLRIGDAAGLSEAGLKYYGHMDLGPGDYRLRVLVRNGETGRTAVASVPLTVPPFDGESPVLLPPFFIEETGRWLLVREASATDSGSVVYPFVLEGDPFVPAARPRLARDASIPVCLMAYGLGRGELEVRGKVLDGQGAELGTARLDRVRRTATGLPGVDRLAATFRPADLPAGSYELRVSVTDPATGESLASSTPFVVD